MRQIMEIISTACMLALCLACESRRGQSVTDGGGVTSTGSAWVDGTVEGRSFQAADAISASQTGGALPIGSGIVLWGAGALEIASSTALCHWATANDEPRNAQHLRLILGDQGCPGLHAFEAEWGPRVEPNFNFAVCAPSTPGTYTVWVPGQGGPSLKFVIVSYYRNDATCQVVAAESAISGTVTITAVRGEGAYSGMFDLTLQQSGGNLDHITGSFDAPVTCPGLANYLQAFGRPTCI
jgi:hypothetical protein